LLKEIALDGCERSCAAQWNENIMIPTIWRCIALLLLLGATSAAATDLQDLEGNPGAVSDYTGKGTWTVVMFWTSDCRVCNAEIHQYVRFHDEHHEADASVLGISLDGTAKKAEAKEFIERHLVDFPNLIGEPGEVAMLFSRLAGQPWLGTPSFLIYSPRGELLAQQVGAVTAEAIEKFIGRR
jgi:peroxiredoxin